MYYYKYQDKYLFSQTEYNDFLRIKEQELIDFQATVFYLTSLDPHKSRKSFCISDSSLLQLKEEGLHLLERQTDNLPVLPQWMQDKISKGLIMAVNTSYPNWQDCLDKAPPSSWRVNIVGLGDVGSTLLIGLKLLGGAKISQIGLYDVDASKVTRWEFECSQILFTNQEQSPRIFAAKENELFDCDMFVFCVTVGIPSLDSKGIDVRMAQFEGNSRIISLYAKKARDARFQGIFAVVSDPVDLLCKKALVESNTNEEGTYDFNGLSPEQVRGYGLGVMHARAVYYAAQSVELSHYLEEGRAFGPHGEHLIISDSMQNYNNDLSLKLTESAKKANLELRQHGYKPYVAPALSSGAISLLDTIHENWHYSATFMGGVYMGARNRLLPAGTVIERYDLPEQLKARLYNSYKELESVI